MFAALCSVIVPQLLDMDRPIFDGILLDVFARTAPEEVLLLSESLEPSIGEAYERVRLCLRSPFVACHCLCVCRSVSRSSTAQPRHTC